MRSALEHGQKHFGYAARGATVTLATGSATFGEGIVVVRQPCEGALP